MNVIGILLICDFFFGFTPRAQADILSCCLCKVAKGEQTANFCVNVTPSSSCQQASSDLVTIYKDNSFTADCQSLDTSGCIIMSSGNTSAQCPFKPATHTSTSKTDINKKYLDTVINNLNAKAQPRAASNDASSASSTGTQSASSTGMQLNVPIPGVDFPDDLQIANDYIIIPYIAIYIAGIQKYAMGLAIVAAAIMLVWGGFKYLLSATGAKIQDARETVKDALLGLVLVLGCVVVLANLNPDTTSLTVLKIPYVKPDYYTTPVAPMNATPGNATKSNESAIVEGAKMANADPCNILAFCEHETGLRQIWNGWPLNPKEKSFSWGACSADAKYLRDGSQADVKMRAAFPNEWPALGTDLPIPAGRNASYEFMPIKAELLINNPKMDGYVIGLEMGKSTIKATADAGIGSANIARWRAANDCFPDKDLTLAEAAVIGADEAIVAYCIPVAAAGGAGCPNDNQNCSPAEPDKVNTITKGYKIETNGVIHGVCASTGAQCFTIWTYDHVRYAIRSYQRFNSKYHCTSASK